MTVLGGIKGDAIVMKNLRAAGEPSAIHLASNTTMICRASASGLELSFPHPIPGIDTGPAHAFRLEGVEEAK